MAKTRTPFTEADKAAHWIRQAERCEREATKCKTAGLMRYWLDTAAEYRTHAESYSLPASGEALTS